MDPDRTRSKVDQGEDSGKAKNSSNLTLISGVHERLVSSIHLR